MAERARRADSGGARPIDARTAADREAALAITRAIDSDQLVREIDRYYADRGRADRTPRDIRLLHLGLVMAADLWD